jgi:hypothetical protein
MEQGPEGLKKLNDLGRQAPFGGPRFKRTAYQRAERAIGGWPMAGT